MSGVRSVRPGYVSSSTGEPRAGSTTARRQREGETSAFDSRSGIPYYTSMDWNRCPVVEREPGKVSGAWVFRGTRVPLASLFENLKDGATVDDYLAWFPGVTRAQVEEVLVCEARSASGTAA